MKASRGALIFLLVLSGAAAFLSMRAMNAPTPAPAIAEDRHAFRNTTWGMSPSEVEKAVATSLTPVTNSRQFYRPSEDDKSVYVAYEQQGVSFLRREADVTYTFRDSHLLSYHVFISDADGDKLDADMRRYLTRTFGDKGSDQEEDTSLKLVWQFKDRFVNYWFMPEELSMRPKYKAGFGVIKK